MHKLVVNQTTKFSSDITPVQPQVVKKSITNELNVYETKVIPNKPKVIQNEQIEVYVPNASYDNPGIASFDENSFIVDPLTGVVKVRGGGLFLAYELEVSSDSDRWEEINGKWQIRIPQTTHNFQKINSIVAERKMDSEIYENMIYSYKRYLTGSVAVIVDNKIDMRIIIKGEK